MSHQLYFIGKTKNQRKLEKINEIFAIPYSQNYPINIKIHTESDLFSLTISIREEGEFMDNASNLKKIKSEIVEFFESNKIEYIFNEELFCEIEYSSHDQSN